MTHERGAVVEATDPFRASGGRPFLVVNTDDHPFHGEQYVAVTLTTRTWYDGTVPLDDADFVEGGVPEDSFVVPWGVASPGSAGVTDRFGLVEPAVVDDVVSELTSYLR